MRISFSNQRRCDPTIPRKQRSIFHGRPSSEGLISYLTNINYLTSFYNTIQITILNMYARPGHAAATTQSVIGRPLALVSFGTSLELGQPPREPPPSISTPSSSHNKITQLSFPMKIGNKNNDFNGICCLFKSDGTTRGINFDSIYNYDGKTPTALIELVPLTPQWADSAPAIGPRCFSQYNDVRAAAYTVFGALVDPFTRDSLL